ncbi:YqcC family protein [Litorilituus sediminis]|uniref:YqcC family protein n=1 Tax=Litorilituus sediminis TaxID=718192 RepID=A0A4P6P4X3_9GAMM|nr:YqcC family protein [Litorilituus sediminis]QBG35149.1 YqcC family protein [Litorilituus sediminis]
MTKAQQATILLKKLTIELMQAGHWQENLPSKEALASTAPFCCDTLTFAQWLQFIFIPRITEMIAAGTSLPSSIALSPLAEEVFKSAKDSSVCVVIAEIDHLLSES